MGATGAAVMEWFGSAAAADGAAAAGADAAAAAGGTAAAGGGAVAAGGAATAGAAAAGGIGQTLLTSAASAAAAAGVANLMAPTPPKTKAPMAMPDPLAQEQARKNSLIEQMARRGRASTILTDSNDAGTLGG